MKQHPEIKSLVNRFQNKELHAAHSGRELMSAFVKLVSDSQAKVTMDLVDEIDDAVEYLLPNIPAYAPPINVLHYFLSEVEKAVSQKISVSELKIRMKCLGDEYLNWSKRAKSKIGLIASELIPKGATIFTFTLSETVLTTLQSVWESGKKFRVLVTESRPNNDGLVTAEKLSQIDVPVEISIDACIGQLIPRTDMMLVGAEAISVDGSSVCKVGTYPSALIARSHGVPVYVIVDTMKLNISSLQGIDLSMDNIEKEDVLPKTIPIDTKVDGHLFDKTPASLISGVLTEKGILNSADCGKLMNGMHFSDDLSLKLTDRYN